MKPFDTSKYVNSWPNFKIVIRIGDDPKTGNWFMIIVFIYLKTVIYLPAGGRAVYVGYSARAIQKRRIHNI
jgi:hypothetical protein